MSSWSISWCPCIGSLCQRPFSIWLPFPAAGNHCLVSTSDPEVETAPHFANPGILNYLLLVSFSTLYNLVSDPFIRLPSIYLIECASKCYSFLKTFENILTFKFMNLFCMCMCFIILLFQFFIQVISLFKICDFAYDFLFRNLCMIIVEILKITKKKPIYNAITRNKYSKPFDKFFSI